MHQRMDVLYVLHIVRSIAMVVPYYKVTKNLVILAFYGCHERTIGIESPWKLQN